MKNGKWTSSRRRIKWSKDNSKAVRITSDGKVIAENPGTATVKAKVGKKTLKCKVKVKGTGVTFTVKPTFDLNAVNKDWVRECSEKYDEGDDDVNNVTWSQIDGFEYNWDDCYWEYKDSNGRFDKAKTKQILDKLRYEDGKKRFYSKVVQPLVNWVSADFKKTVASSDGKDYIVQRTIGKPYNKVTVTVRNNTSKTVTVKKKSTTLGTDAYSAIYGNEGSISHAKTPDMHASKTTKVAPHSSATIVYTLDKEAVCMSFDEQCWPGMSSFHFYYKIGKKKYGQAYCMSRPKQMVYTEKGYDSYD